MEKHTVVSQDVSDSRHADSASLMIYSPYCCPSIIHFILIVPNSPDDISVYGLLQFEIRSIELVLPGRATSTLSSRNKVQTRGMRIKNVGSLWEKR